MLRQLVLAALLLLVMSAPALADERPLAPSIGVLEPRLVTTKLQIPSDGLWSPPEGDFVCADTVRVLDEQGKRLESVSCDPAKGQCRLRLDGCIRFSSDDRGRTVTVLYRYRPHRVAVLPAVLGTDYADARSTLSEALNRELERLGFFQVSADDTADALARARKARGVPPDGEPSAECLREIAATLDVAYLLVPGIAAEANSVFAGYTSSTQVQPSGKSAHTTTTAINRHYMDVAAGLAVYDGLTGSVVFRESVADSKRVLARAGHASARKSLVSQLVTRLLSQWRNPIH